MKTQLKFLSEPGLIFGNGQRSIDPRDGLMLFGPYEKLGPHSIRAGVVGTSEGLNYYKTYVDNLNAPIYSKKRVYGVTKSDEMSRPSYPGFEAVFGVSWPRDPEVLKEISKDRIRGILSDKNKKRRTHDLVDLYLRKVTEAQRDEHATVDIWFIVVPREVYIKCRPESKGRQLSEGTLTYLRMAELGQSSLQFSGEEDYVERVSKFVDTSTDFHDLLKARLIQERIQVPIQIELESTLQFRDKYKNTQHEDNIKAHLAWTQTTTLYYKLGKLPWKLKEVREGVCYLGFVFKRMNQATNRKSVCSAAQMFLSDGDGSVFRGQVGLWQSENEKEYHLDEVASEELIGKALDDYHLNWGKYPKELFIHGRAYFSEKEWAGFTTAVQKRSTNTNLVAVVIKEAKDLKLFRDVDQEKSDFGVLRGLAFELDNATGYLFTRGFIPRLQTSNSIEVPNPLSIKIVHGESSFETVARDILALTKLNYNACIYGDGMPVTLRFSDDIGKILTAIDEWKVDTRQFKYYI